MLSEVQIIGIIIVISQAWFSWLVVYEVRKMLLKKKETKG